MRVFAIIKKDGIKYRCECKESTNKGYCDTGFIQNPSNVGDVGDYLDCKNCKCRKRLIDKLVEECSENIVENVITYNKSLNDCKNTCNICIIYCIICHCFFNNHYH